MLADEVHARRRGACRRRGARSESRFMLGDEVHARRRGACSETRCMPGDEVHARRRGACSETLLVTLGTVACFNTAQLRQVHQFFVGCSVEPRLRMEAINDMGALKETCREAFECTKTDQSVTQQQVSETLRHMGLSVEDEVRCPKSEYSIDLIVTAAGGWEARGAAARAHGRWNSMVLRTSSRAGRQRVPPC